MCFHQTPSTVHMSDVSVVSSKNPPPRPTHVTLLSSAVTNSARGRHDSVLSVHQPSPTVHVADMAVCSVFISRHQQCRWQTWLCAECSSAVTNSAGGRHGCVLSVHQPSPTVQVGDMTELSVHQPSPTVQVSASPVPAHSLPCGMVMRYSRPHSSLLTMVTAASSGT